MVGLEWGIADLARGPECHYAIADCLRGECRLCAYYDDLAGVLLRRWAGIALGGVGGGGGGVSCGVCRPGNSTRLIESVVVCGPRFGSRAVAVPSSALYPPAARDFIHYLYYRATITQALPSKPFPSDILSRRQAHISPFRFRLLHPHAKLRRLPIWEAAHLNAYRLSCSRLWTAARLSGHPIALT